jgi:hypothetical protein
VRVAAQARNALEVVARAAARSAPAEVHQARAGANREALPAAGARNAAQTLTLSLSALRRRL